MSNSESSQQKLIPQYNKAHPCKVRLKDRELLTHPSSSKKTYHISLDLKGSDLGFLPGDSIGVLPQNDPVLVQKLLSLLQCTPNELLTDPRSQEEMTAEYYLSHKVNFSRINSSLLRHFLSETKDPSLKDTLHFLLEAEHKQALAEFLQGKDLIDIIRLLQVPSSSLQELAPHFTPLLPRFYSISSSLKTHPEELHLLVALLSYQHGNELRYGVASHFLCHLAVPRETTIPVYVQPAAHFRLPEDLHQNILMIGPGTGVAPYKAFLEQRVHEKAPGKHWLFFGERQSAYDFFYQNYWRQLENQGLLRLTTAFSRDQETKQYVQHRLLEASRDVWQWISEGCTLYVCGDASRMAKDVENTLLAIIQKEGNLSESEAKSYLKGLRTSKRYLTDVY